MRTFNRARSIPLVFVDLIPFSVSAQTSGSTAANQLTLVSKGRKAPAGNFTGTVWVHSLVGRDLICSLSSESITFGPGARSDWNSHPGDQILLVTEGTG
jgi:quercetin dioxygenase-like cupin family protein